MVVFVILHYSNIDDTIECVESIKKISGNKKIIIVDNNSTTGQEQKIIKKISDDCIFLEENLGFAKGNNVGCKYAIDKYNPDFLVVVNNDTIIYQKDFIYIIEELYAKYNFDVLGPKILPEKSDSCNPFPIIKDDDLDDKIKYTKKLIKIYKNPILRFALKIYTKTKRLFIKPIKISNGKDEQINVALHGCAIVFPKKYYLKYNDIFIPETFLFHEEEFLYHRILKDGLISLYSPKLEILHKEGQSIKKEKGTNYKSLLFRNKEILNSLIILKEYKKKNR